jgi:hypothetical protein
MAPSDVKRFVAYLNNLSQQSTIKVEDSDGIGLLSAAGTDFEETQELLKLFVDDDRVGRVLMDPTEQTLQDSIQSVQDLLRTVESKSIAAYIEESNALNELHEQVCLDGRAA